MLFLTPELTTTDLDVLGQVEEMRQKLRRQVQGNPSTWVRGMRKFLTADAVAASNTIEGFRVSTIDVQDLMEGEKDVDVSDENREETLAYQRMMTYIQTLHDADDFEYSKGLLNALHWMLQGHRHTLGKVAGQWRRGSVYVTDPADPAVAVYTAPDAAAVPELMADLIDWLNADYTDHPLVRAAMAHLHLVSIHPWPDGNGRMSRSLQTLMIAREGVLAPEFSSIEAWLGRSRNTWTYYQELQRRGTGYHPDQDVSSWIRFNLTAYHQQAQTVQNRISRSTAVWESLLPFAAREGLEERMVSALHDVAVHRRLRRAHYEQAESLTLQQAQRDLKTLAAAGLLEPVGRTRARYYVEGASFPARVLETARTPMTLSRPYPDALG
ncbi:cell division protein Fic [Actinoplanes philippinensis]|uniref:Fic family protein n=1 Tax=Actinoplanes philippinensis TaxID=35752 RepID=A0A1I2IQY2_9ACTN|nr:Fic family protein [Actinoplanes philippinensis]GIE79023.1 cell division protein Fic [Actinoplanes philippinensis]SFF44822.1 Fic family protein [Actinoplanes philippinensis]